MKRELRMRKTPQIVAALLATFLLLGMTAQQATAAAGDPATDPTASQYDNPGSTLTQEDTTSDDGQIVVTTPTSGDGGGTESTSGASLPFTGFDVGVLAIVALLLGATGLALRRLSAAK